MRENLLRQGQARAHQEGRPVNRVKAGNVLTDNMQTRRPEGGVNVAVCFGISGHGQIIGQRIHPDINHMLRIVGHRHAPIESRARY